MVKVHTRVKRRKDLVTSFRHRKAIAGTPGKGNRPKTYKTQELAETRAKEKGLKDYRIVSAKKTKFKIVC